jgi:ABC-type amino acid transport substrate-binding protein
MIDKIELRVGVVPDRPPLAYRDAMGALAGSEVDLIREFAKRNGVELALTEYDLDDLFIALRRGSIDIAVPAATEREIAARFFAVCAPHDGTGQRLVANAEIAPFITELKQIDNGNVRVYTVTGSPSAEFARRFFKSADIASLENIDQCVGRVLNDNGCVFLTDETTALNLLKKYNAAPKKAAAPSKTKKGALAADIEGGRKTEREKEVKPVIALVLGRLTNEKLAWATERSNKKLKKILDDFTRTLKRERENPTFERVETPLFETGVPSPKLKRSVFSVAPR